MRGKPQITIASRYHNKTNRRLYRLRLRYYQIPNSGSKISVDNATRFRETKRRIKWGKRETMRERAKWPEEGYCQAR